MSFFDEDNAFVVDTLREVLKITDSNLYRNMKEGYRYPMIDVMMYKSCVAVCIEEADTRVAVEKIICHDDNVFINNLSSPLSSQELSWFNGLILENCLSIRNRLISSGLIRSNMDTICYVATLRSGNSLLNIL